MPNFTFTSPDGKRYTVSGPEGATKEQAFEILQKQIGSSSTAPQQEPKPKQFGEQMNDAIRDIPRQLGLTARTGLKGIGNTVGILSDPIGGIINKGLDAYDSVRAPTISELVTGKQRGTRMLTAGGLAEQLADSIGLPKPANATERIVAAGAEMLTPAGGLAKTAQLGAQGIPRTATLTRSTLEGLAANPTQQLVSAGTAGLSGGYVRETGGNEGAQFVASLAGGLAAPYAMNKAQEAGRAGNRLISMMARQPDVPQIDIQITQALRGSGLTLEDLPANVRNSIRQDVQEALRLNGPLSPDAVRRLADYRLTGATPTAGTLTLDPAIVSQQKNLAKLGINSKDAAAQQLGQVENANNRLLIDRMNEVGANTPIEPRAAGERVMNALEARNARAQALINRRYEQARATDGRSANLDPSTFTQTANDLLDQNLLGGKLPADVRNLLNRAATGEMPLTVDVAEQFKTRIGALQRSSTDPQERLALGMVRRALDDTPLLDGQGQPAINAFNRARRLNASWMQVVERTPALQAVRDGIEPDKFVQTYIVGNGSRANVADLEALRSAVRSDPATLGVIREQIAAHLKRAALNNAADEVGNFSQSSFNKALNAIGQEKLSMFFTPEQVNQIRAIGRVASYEQFQPRGAAVNNSNTAGAAIANILDRIGNSSMLSKIPLGSALSQPAQNIAIGMRSQNALNAPNALLAPRVNNQRAPMNMLLSPAVLLGSQEQ